MTARDRIVVICIAVAVILAGVWIELVSPERKQVGQLEAKVSAAKSKLESAQGQVAGARTAESQYSSAYAAMVHLGKAVPPSEEVPSLIYELTRASDEKDVDFASITPGGGSSTSAGASTSTSGAAATPASSGGSFEQLPFTFTFEGGYFQLERLFRRLADFATMNTAGNVEVSGRLLTIQSVSLSGGGSSAAEGKSSSKLTGSVTATAYVLPGGQGVSSAAPGAPAAGASPSSAAAGTSASSPTAPAVVKVTP